MKIIAISDLHGDLIDINECDLLLIAGDTIPLNIQVSSRKSEKWLKKEFREWIDNLPCEKVLMIAGNHDFAMENQTRMTTLFPESDKCTYLLNSVYSYTKDDKTIKVFGTPYCKIFGNWAFMEPSYKLEEYFSLIPNDIDILLTHDAPYGTSDICMENTPWNDGSHIGNIPLRDAIIEKSPKYNLHGHLHSTNHECEMLNDTKVFNVSIKNERYEITYQPLELIL